MLLNQDEARGLVRKVLARSQADGCRVWTYGWEERNFRFASRGGATNGSSSNVRLEVTATFGRQLGRATTSSLDEAALQDVVARAEAAARTAPPNPEVLPPLGPQDYQAGGAYDTASAGLAADAVAALLKPAVEQGAASQIGINGYTQASRSWRAYATNAGAFGYDRSTRALLSVSARNADQTWSGWAGGDANALARLDPAAIGGAAVEKARANLPPISLEPGKYVAILEPAVVAHVVSGLVHALQGRAADEGRSFLSRSGGGNRQGERLFDRRVNIWSDPTDALAPGTGFGSDGLPHRLVRWVEDGVVASLARSRYWAAKTDSAPLSLPGNYTMGGGEDSLADMIGSVKRGILVSRLWYVRSVDPRSLLATGLTRDGNFLIEDGRLTRPVNNFRFNESPLNVLNNILAIGPSRRAYLHESWDALAVPPLLVKDFHFTSVSLAV